MYTFRLLIDIETPDSGPIVKAGTLVGLLDTYPTTCLVVPLEAFKDFGNGPDEPTVEYTTCIVTFHDMECVFIEDAD